MSEEERAEVLAVLNAPAHCDKYNRKIVAWQVHERERAPYAAELAAEACYVEAVSPHEVVLHSDNGSPVKGATMLAALRRLGLIPLFSRP